MTTDNNGVRSTCMMTLLVLAIGAGSAWAGWTADTMPNYTEDVLAWWANHPFNADGTNYDPTITSPPVQVTLNPGDSIASAIDALPAGGGTIQLNPGLYTGSFDIVGQDNVHIIAPSGATIRSSSAHYVIACEGARDYHSFNFCVYQRQQDCIDCFRDPVRNIYFKNITFDGNNSSLIGVVTSVVRGVVFEGCTFQNFVDPGDHHRGLVTGNMKIENVWFLDCDFVGDERFGFYLDGSHGGGVVDSRFYDGCYSGVLYLTNDDFSEDQNDDGLWQPGEKRNGQYNVIANNWFEGQDYCIDINQSRSTLILDNECAGSCNRFIYSTDRCSQRWFDLFYIGFDNRVIGNVVADCAVFYEINSRQFNCIQSGDCWNYGNLGKYVVRGNVVTGTAGEFMRAHGALVQDPRVVELNCFNDPGCTCGTGCVADPDAGFTNVAPTVTITAPSDSGTVPVAHDITISAAANDSDGAIAQVEFRVNNTILSVDDTAPYEAVWPHYQVVHGQYTLSAIARDDDGYLDYDEITVTAADTADTATATASPLPLAMRNTLGLQKTTSLTLDLANVGNAVLVVEGFDIDAVAEATLWVNGIQQSLPCWVFADGGPHRASRSIDPGLLVDGVNDFTFEFSDNLGGSTSGYDVQNLQVILSTDYSGTRTAQPQFDPDGGTFGLSATVTITCTTPDADIYYTTDGTVPDETSTLYTQPVVLTEDTTLMARAFADGKDPSLVKVASYVVSGDVTAPSVPQDVVATDVGRHDVTLSWTASTDNIAVTGYNVYESGSLVGTTDQTTFTHLELASADDYSYTVTAFDAGTNESGHSSPAAAARTLVDPDLNSDGFVNDDDVAVFRLDWPLAAGGLTVIGDIDNNNAVELMDLYYIIDAWGESPSAFQQDSGVQGIVSIEAEHYAASVEASGHAWTTVTSPTGYSGTAAMQSLPNDGTNISSSTPELSPRMDYYVQFVHAGTHYVWGRGYAANTSDDSCHVGMNGVALSTSDNLSNFTPEGQYSWGYKTMDSGTATIDIPSPGVYVLNVWMREDGLTLDKIVLTTDPLYVPVDAGPTESPMVP